MLRVGFISDIHVDVNASSCGPAGPAAAIALAAREKKLDILVIPGDISGDWTLSLRTLERIRQDAGIPVHFVPGNHDLWNTHHPDMDARRIYDRLMEDEGNLARGPIALPGSGSGWAIAGDTGWYDFSFGDDAIPEADFHSMQLGRRVWQDRTHAKWGAPAPEIHAWFMERIKRSLDAAAGLGRHLVFVTHVVQRREFTVPPQWKSWHYFNAFLGSGQYGELAAARGVAISAFGHVHFRKHGLYGVTEHICPCLGYARQWWDPQDPAKEISDSLIVRELG